MFRVTIVILALALGACGGGRVRTADPTSYIDLATCAPGGEFTLESTNPYFPMDVGKKWVLEGGDERVEITVLEETEVVAGGHQPRHRGA